MVVFEFTVDDLARTRFAISPMWELVATLRLLREPTRAALHLPWMRDALPIARELDLREAFALIPVQGYMPDFLTPPPETPIASFADELARVRATTPDRVAADLAKVPSAPAGVDLPRLADRLEAFWQRALAPHWPRIRALLEADLLHRAHELTAGGQTRLFADLHPLVRWTGDALEVQQSFENRIRLAGRGLLLLPSASQWVPASISTPPWQPTLIYPARGVAVLWEKGPPRTGEALAAVLGRTRAQLLTLLDAPRSTTELARRLELAPGGVSMHLSALRAAGLVSTARHGRTVLYMRTPLADRLQRPT